jgi:hypothetical protein
MTVKKNDWLYIAGLTLLVTVVWVVVSAVGQARRSTVPPDLEQIIQPFDASLDESVLGKLSEKTP